MADNDLWRSKATTVSSLRRPSTAALAHRQYSTQEAMLNSRVETGTTPKGASSGPSRGEGEEE